MKKNYAWGISTGLILGLIISFLTDNFAILVIGLLIGVCAGAVASINRKH
ncbi:hypothetical protein [Alistipes sp.]